MDITFRLANGRRYREQNKAPICCSGSRTTTENEQGGSDTRTVRAEVLGRIRESKPKRHCVQGTVLRVHVVPVLGHKCLDAISNEDVQRLKLTLRDKAANTVKHLVSAEHASEEGVEWDVIARIPRA